MKQLKKPMKGKMYDGVPDVTVITVVFNALKGAGEAVLKECLDSVQSQTDINLEHLIIDGASNDGTTEFIAGYDNQNHPIVFISEPDKGIYDAMNKAIDLAKGEYSIFLNSDDFFHNPVGMRESVKRLRETGCDFSYAPVIVIKDGKELDALHSHADGRLIFCAMPFSHQSMVSKTASLRKVNGYDDRSYRSSADYDMILRMVFAGCTACFVNCAFATFRVGGFSSQNIHTSQHECAVIYSRLFPEITGYPLSVEKAFQMFRWKIIPREIMVALIEYYTKSFRKWQPPLMPIMPPENAVSYSLDVREKATHEDEWVKKLIPVWENENCKKIFAEEPPQDTVWASDFWHLYSPFLYCRQGVWCDGSLGVLFRVPDNMINSRLRLRIALTSFYRQDMPCQRLRFAINGNLFSSVSVRRGMSSICELELPKSAVADGLLGIEINCGDASYPAYFRKSIDMKPQGFMFSYAKVEVV